MVGEQVGQSLLFSRGQSLGGRQHGYSVADGLSDQSFAAGLPRDPDRHRAHLPPVDPVVVAAVPGRTERNHLAGQAPPPRRRCRDAAAVHALGAGQQDRPRHPPHRLRVGLDRPGLVPVTTVTIHWRTSQGSDVRVGHREPLRPRQLIRFPQAEGHQAEPLGPPSPRLPGDSCSVIQTGGSAESGKCRRHTSAA